MRFWSFIFILLIASCTSPEEAPPDPNGGKACDGKGNTPLVLELPSNFPAVNLPGDLTEEKFELGRHLFFEKKLSRNNTTSCGSCHQQSKAFTDGLRFSLGLNGEQTARGAMAVVNLLWEDKFFWDSRALSLQEQALMPIQDHIEMDLTLPEAVQRLHGDTLYNRLFCKAYGSTQVTPEKIADAIAIFEMALISKDSRYDKYLRGEVLFSAEEKEGLRLFSTHPVFGGDRGGNCGDCHVPIITNGFKGPKGMKNNGLDYDSSRTDMGYFNVTQNANDIGKFKTPTLRNIELTAPYMHDGRFQTLEEVLDHYNEHVRFSNTLDPLVFASNGPDSLSLKLELFPFEKQAIIAFLKTLTDTTFTGNPRFSDPFTN